jgi:hypothetical protein
MGGEDTSPHGEGTLLFLCLFGDECHFLIFRDNIIERDRVTEVMKVFIYIIENPLLWNAYC